MERIAWVTDSTATIGRGTIIEMNMYMSFL